MFELFCHKNVINNLKTELQGFTYIAGNTFIPVIEVCTPSKI